MSAPHSLLVIGLCFGTLLLPVSFSLGSRSAQRSLEQQIAANDARLVALRDEMVLGILQIRQAHASRPSAAEEIKRQLQNEMGLLPVGLLRQRSESFVQLDASDSHGKSSYGTAGYLGHGHFITVKHGVMALGAANAGSAEPLTVTLRYGDRDIPARVVDSGDAKSEVDPGDWAIIKVEADVDLPPLRVDVDYAYQFAEPIFRLGNDYSKGILLSTGYVGRRTSNGLVTCLTDGHPGASGGGILDREGNLVGIPVGRMSGDYRFSFILPLRAEMFAKVPGLAIDPIETTYDTE